ncbi:Translation initiation factor 3 subunit b [Coemansia interrupta]|uniref:Eukaryotic translation initiation factor 3 subunit B n=1 Tax=Coemansia interrupta TaxID=1126814 RepID=A0A9W8H807_9FUNG|nr:Translation initiation factor 3 subunit b [Coemansia interrupta]
MVEFTANNLPAAEADIDFSDLEKQFVVPEHEETLENVVVVDNIPVVDEAKEEKLVQVLKKVFKKHGTVKANGIHMPKETGSSGKAKTKGYAFVEFETAQQAHAAIANLNGYKLDKSHSLLVNAFMDVERYTEINDVYQAPPEEPFEEREHLRSWLSDAYGRDQFVVYADHELSVFWNETAHPAEKVISRSNWTEAYAQWSPLGSFLCTVHEQGLVLWGGPSWKKLARFIHRNVKLIDFSPSERYLVTCSTEPISVDAVNQMLGAGNEHQNPYSIDDEGHTVCVWDAQTGSLLRSFPPIKTEDGKLAKGSWPQFKWSPSEKYLARMTYNSSLSVYEADTMALLDKKSIKVPGIQDFSWCPRVVYDPRTNAARPEMLAYWTPEEGNLPARVTLMSVPSRTIVRTKNLFNVFSASLHWHPEGQALCVRVQRYTKSKKSRFTNLEIFRAYERDVPVDVIELKDCAVAFDWEPVADNMRFAIIHTDDPTPPVTNATGIASTAVNTSVSFYAFERKGKLVKKEGFQLLKTFDRKKVTALKWSPQGRHIILATLRTISTFELDFVDTEFDQSAANKSGVAGDAISILATGEHYGVTDLEWDPTGRYVVTMASSWRHSMEHGYILWDFKGELIHKTVVERFKQLIWRPRPRSLLSDEKKREIRKDLKSFSKELDEQDERRLHAADAELMSQRRRLISEWQTWREQVDAMLASETDEALQSGYKLPIVADDQEFVVDEIVEEVIEEKEEIIN